MIYPLLSYAQSHIYETRVTWFKLISSPIWQKPQKSVHLARFDPSSLFWFFPMLCSLSEMQTVVLLFLLLVLQQQHFFEDPDGKLDLPASLRVDHWKRPQDFITEKVNVVWLRLPSESLSVNVILTCHIFFSVCFIMTIFFLQWIWVVWITFTRYESDSNNDNNNGYFCNTSITVSLMCFTLAMYARNPVVEYVGLIWLPSYHPVAVYAWLLWILSNHPVVW